MKTKIEKTCEELQAEYDGLHETLNHFWWVMSAAIVLGTLRVFILNILS